MFCTCLLCICNVCAGCSFHFIRRICYCVRANFKVNQKWQKYPIEKKKLDTEKMHWHFVEGKFPYIIHRAENQYHFIAFYSQKKFNTLKKKRMEKKLQTLYTAFKWIVFDLFSETNRQRLTFHSILYGCYIEPQIYRTHRMSVSRW